jgi:hypothetical protein
MQGRFDYVKYDAEAVKDQETAKTLCQDLETFIELSLPKGRAQSLALTKLEEVYMWIGKAIRDEQVTKRGAELQEERSNE